MPHINIDLITLICHRLHFRLMMSMYSISMHRAQLKGINLHTIEVSCRFVSDSSSSTKGEDPQDRQSDDSSESEHSGVCFSQAMPFYYLFKL